MKKLLLPLLALLLTACPSQHTPSPEALPPELHDPALAAELDERFLMIYFSPYEEKANQQISLRAYTYRHDQLTLEQTLTIPLGGFPDQLMHMGQVVQPAKKLHKVYFTLANHDLYEGTFESCRLMEFDAPTGSIREILTFTQYLDSWYYYEPTHTIYAYDRKEFALVAIDPASSETKAVASFEYGEGTIHPYPVNDQRLLIFIDQEDGFFRCQINPLTGQATLTRLDQVSGISSYRNEMYVRIPPFYFENRRLTLTGPTGSRSLQDVDYGEGSFWISDDKFLVRKQDYTYHLLNTQLEVVGQFHMPGLTLWEVLDNSILVAWYQGEVRKLGLLDFELRRLTELPGINPKHMISIMNLN